MNPLTFIYWIKASMGLAVGIICALLWVNVYTGIGIAAFTYILADKVLRQLFIGKVDRPSTVTKTGIGMYIFSWIFFWTLVFTLLHPPA